MVQVVRRRPVTKEARKRSKVSQNEICGEGSNSRTGLSRSASIFPCLYHSILVVIKMLLLPEGQTGEAWEFSRSNALLQIWVSWTGRNFGNYRRVCKIAKSDY